MLKWIKRIYDEVTSYLCLMYRLSQLSLEDQEKMLAEMEEMIEAREGKPQA